MANAGQQVARCAYPGCENEPRPGPAEPGYCGLPDPVTGEPHTALTAFRQRQVPAGQSGQAAGPEEPGRPGFAFWRRAGAQRRQRAEAEVAEARSAALQADAQLAEALAGRAAAEQEAAAAQARAAAAQRDAAERVAAAQQERDDAVAGAESRTRDAGQDAARARETAQSARAEPDRARVAADLQARKIREDAARDQAELRAAFEAQIAAAEEARATLQARAEHAEAQAAQAHSATATRRPRRPPRHNPHARHDAAGALRKLSEEQLRAQNIPFGSGTGGHVGYQVADRIGGSRTPDPVNPGGGPATQVARQGCLVCAFPVIPRSLA